MPQDSLSHHAPPYRALWPDSAQRPLLGFAGWSGAGKTTLLAAIIPRLVARGLRVALIKHAHHRFDVDQPGKDSHTLRKAGACQVLLTSGLRYALMHDRPQERDPVLAEELLRLDQSCVDIILVEGFRDERFPKIEVFRAALGRPSMHTADDSIIALASDSSDSLESMPASELEQAEKNTTKQYKNAYKKPEIPFLNLNDSEMITDFIIDHFLTFSDPAV